MNELNKKLLEFAGFKEADIKKHYYFELGGERRAKWIEPDTDYHIKPPDFTSPTWGIAYCFKWLVPKLFAVDIHTIWTSTETVYEAYMAVAHKDSDNDYRATELTPALALCLAIEKLIKV